MSADWDSDDLARMLAIEHAFGALSLMWAFQFATSSQTLPSEAAQKFKDAVISSLYDSKDNLLTDKITHHLERMLGNLEKMAKNADKGFR